MGYYSIPCENCGHFNDVNWNYCHNKDCAELFSAPFIVRRASMKVEREALEQKYIAAKKDLNNSGKESDGILFENAVLEHGKVVINTTANFVFEWFLRSKLPYMPYRKQIAWELREHAEFANAAKRSYVDSAIFADREMIFGALTINETGLGSYGPVTMFLNSNVIRKRSALLRENSFTFHERIIEEHKWTIDVPIPPGNLSVWSDRNKLALVKCYEKIKKNNDSALYPKFVLNSQNSRRTDEFIEVYIDGDLYPDMVEKIKFPKEMIQDFGQKPELIEYKFQYDEVKSKVRVEEYV